MFSIVVKKKREVDSNFFNIEEYPHVLNTIKYLIRERYGEKDYDKVFGLHYESVCKRYLTGTEVIRLAERIVELTDTDYIVAKVNVQLMLGYVGPKSATNVMEKAKILLNTEEELYPSIWYCLEEMPKKDYDILAKTTNGSDRFCFYYAYYLPIYLGYLSGMEDTGDTGINITRRIVSDIGDTYRLHFREVRLASKIISIALDISFGKALNLISRLYGHTSVIDLKESFSNGYFPRMRVPDYCKQ